MAVSFCRSASEVPVETITWFSTATGVRAIKARHSSTL
ncbi:GMP reductase|nr:GMP reductase [Candidatus Pantoea persica]